jgi:ABC-type lipoprotein release transport system permease subunit
VGTVATGRAVVVARADTPARVLAVLHRDGGGNPTTYAAVADRIDRTPEARSDSLALLVAIGVGLVALTHLLAWLAGQAGRRRTEVAGLRSAGVGPGPVRRAYLAEAAILAGIVLVAAGVTAVLTTVPLLEPMRLVGGWTQGPELHPSIRPLTLASVVIGAAAVTVVVCAVAFTRFGRDARPSALRAAER